ncbi:hypothetical protein DFQ27_009827 [Actinomortierella ambigua]|uniref:FAD-binding PCMH-type domain-containing protein n=1 Tax=Actinomortierella ambigua TaxID=1343610 RepID=A0A9P6QDS8_9FUNG|nr:hypothetical protein DFQ27_009827 [Actinomortierella ambigua]
MRLQKPSLASFALVAASWLCWTDIVAALPASTDTCMVDIKGSSNSTLTTQCSADYETQRFAFDWNFNYHPLAIYYPSTVDDAAAAIRYAAANKISVAPRSGGHSFEAYGVGGRDGSLVIDLKNFQQFSVDPDTEVATIGAGTRLGPLYTRLNATGHLIPAGTCPTVGIGGISLGGGVGFWTRLHGATTQNVVGMTMINAKGEVIEVSKTSNPELFWALRGAGGGSFGLVTEFKVQAYKAPPVVTVIVMTWPVEKFRDLIHAYGTWGATVDKGAFAALVVSGTYVELMVNYQGNTEQTQAILQPLLNMTGEPTNTTTTEGNWWTAASLGGRGVDVENPDLQHHRNHRGRSLVYRGVMSDAEMDVIESYIYNSTKPETSTKVYVTYELWGGKIDDPEVPSVFDYHKGVVYSIQTGILWDVPGNKPGVDCAECTKWSLDFSNALQAVYSSGDKIESYQNYMDHDLPNAMDAYFGPNLQRLIDVKNAIDPDNVFSFPQSIPLKQES